MGLIVSEVSVYLHNLDTINDKFESISLTARSSIIQDDALFEAFAAAALDPLQGADTSIRYE